MSDRQSPHHAVMDLEDSICRSALLAKALTLLGSPVTMLPADIVQQMGHAISEELHVLKADWQALVKQMGGKA